ncbi:CAP-Gly domain-containing protein [Caerostris darwini]|uniref:CAP-Gly domain-containing protein n=1 Tax=Caerostris darwini TaxID=1538125 RepID=A0AAV4NPP0_9ARAC|nr:CAP-Gly domain-containing protein [Caerostris darwini]
MEIFKLDDRVKVIGKNVKGKVAFIGKTHLSEGTMFGIVLDKPKGRSSGTIGGVRYFMCPKNHGVFVRSCQLEPDSGDSSHDSDDSSTAIAPRPIYPNYLKHSSKLNFRKSKSHSKDFEHVSKVNTLKQDIQQRSVQDTVQSKDTDTKDNSDSAMKIGKNKQLHPKFVDKRAAIDEKIRFLSEKVNERNCQIDNIHRNLKKLKTYLKWSRGFDNKGNQMKALLDNVIDGVIKNMEESIDEGEFGKFYDFSAGDSGLEKENSILIQQVWDLEKKNETLVNCVTQIRDILLNSWGKPRSLSRNNDTHRKTNADKTKRNNISPKKQNIINSETSRVKQCSNEIPLLNQKQLGEIEKEKQYLDSLHEKKSKKKCVGDSKTEQKLNESSTAEIKAENMRNYIESLAHDIKQYNRETNADQKEEVFNNSKENSKTNLECKNIEKIQGAFNSNDINENSKGDSSTNTHSEFLSSEDRLRFEPYTVDERPKFQQNTSDKSDHALLEGKNSTTDLFELISNLMNNIAESEQDEPSANNMSKIKERKSEPTDSHNKHQSEEDSCKIEKTSNNMKLSKSEDVLKSSKTSLTGNTRKEKPPRKSVYSNQNTDKRKHNKPERKE